MHTQKTGNEGIAFVEVRLNIQVGILPTFNSHHRTDDFLGF